METLRIGWIGTGIMGASMCGHLMAAGHPVSVFTRTRTRAEPLLARGATWADTPRAVAAASDVVFTMVGHPADVREVVLGPEGVLTGAAPGTILVDMSTSEPALAREIAAAANARGIASLDAPVSGGDIGAREARLSIMVGGDAATFARVRPLFERMGRTIVHQGPAGSGQHTKMVNQILIATGMIGVCEALVYARKSGLDVPTVLESVSGGAAGSWSLTNYVPRLEKGDLAPGFMIEHFVKDMGIALAESKRMGLVLPGLELAERLYAGLVAQGHGRKGIQALLLALEQA
ncbi:MAG: beta-hydroxyacid dehydrogenase, 3-hydroxyisobutyrate dehydrogenase [Deltaproteobacteria bacterium]|nr:beta-hydroxyacid dehydrogenase, 3-hydroxyisobutyrate dehydrogenase [Deltaproteobacteria bacterium]